MPSVGEKAENRSKTREKFMVAENQEVWFGWISAPKKLCIYPQRRVRKIRKCGEKYKNTVHERKDPNCADNPINTGILCKKVPVSASYVYGGEEVGEGEGGRGKGW